MPNVFLTPHTGGETTRYEANVIEILLENLASASQEYLGNTSVLVTTLTDSHGATLRITDFVPRFKQYDRIFRPAMLIRRPELQFVEIAEHDVQRDAHADGETVSRVAGAPARAVRRGRSSDPRLSPTRGRCIP